MIKWHHISIVWIYIYNILLKPCKYLCVSLLSMFDMVPKSGNLFGSITSDSIRAITWPNITDSLLDEVWRAWLTLKCRVSPWLWARGCIPTSCSHGNLTNNGVVFMVMSEHQLQSINLTSEASNAPLPDLGKMVKGGFKDSWLQNKTANEYQILWCFCPWGVIRIVNLRYIMDC